MIHLSELITRESLEHRTFLILGKGPSLSNLASVDDKRYVTISLNHAISATSPFIASVIDFDVALACADEIMRNSRYLLMPYYPHFRSKPTGRNLDSLLNEHLFLKELDSESRLVWYNLGTTRRSRPGYPIVPGGLFSGDVIVSALASVGVKRIRTLGIDGGATYCSSFGHLTDKTLLINGQPSFDVQFQRIRRCIADENLDYSAVDEGFPIKIYVGGTEAQMLATRVLEYSIRKHTTRPVEFIPIHQSGLSVRQPKEAKNRGRTPFSFQRFLIPKLNDYQGKAIYLDSDMQVFTDISTLWSLPMGDSDILTVQPGRSQGRRLQFSVMLMDCSRLNWDMDEIVRRLDCGEIDYPALVYRMELAKRISADISEHWNSLERFLPGVTHLTHYTDMETQPWVSTQNPLEPLWVLDLLDAVDKGAISIGLIQEHADRGWVRPSLLFQVEHQIPDSRQLPEYALRQDRQFSPPFNKLSFAAPARTLAGKVAEAVTTRLSRIRRRLT